LLLRQIWRGTSVEKKERGSGGELERISKVGRRVKVMEAANKNGGVVSDN